MAQSQITLTVGEKSVKAILADNKATSELVALLSQRPVTIEMSDYGGFEKVGALPRSLTASDSRITTIAGDIMLYQGNKIVIFYGSNVWNYTPLGRIEGATSENLKSFLGAGNVTLTLSLAESSGLSQQSGQKDTRIYTIDGTVVNHCSLAPGVYIINGNKIIVNNKD